MTRTIRIELLKLSSVRSTWTLGAVGMALTALDAALIAAQAGSGKLAPLDTGPGLRDVLATTGATLLVSWVLGILVATSEARHRNLARTYLAFPHRGTVLLAKGAAAGCVGACVGAIGAAITVATGLAFAAGHGDPLSLAGTTIARYALGTVVASALLGTLGVVVGSVVRAQLPAVVGVLLWAFFVESILASTAAPAAGPYLPFTAATTLAGARLGSGGFGFPNFPTTAPLPFFSAAGLVAGIVVLVAAIAIRTSLRADVS